MFVNTLVQLKQHNGQNAFGRPCMSTAKYCEPKSIKKYFDKFLKLVKVPKSEPKSIASKKANSEFYPL